MIVDTSAVVATLRESAGIEVVPFGDAHAAAAVDAWLRFVGDDFARTDLASA
jgi:uncharacterized protein with PIN domain